MGRRGAMRIHVLEVTPDRSAVLARSSLGVVSARWAGPDRAVPGQEAHVEVDLDLVLDASNTRRAPLDAPALLEDDGEDTIVQGLVERVDDDGVVALRLAPDCVVLVETAGGFSVGESVRVTAPRGTVAMSPVDL